MASVKVFVAARGNQFMAEIAGWIAEAASVTGRSAVVIDDRLPRADGSINLVVAPHEFFELFSAPHTELDQAAAASVCINTEQPGTTWFRIAADACRRGLLTLDINDLGVDAMRAEGIAAERLCLGGVESLRTAVAVSDRQIDVLFMGGIDDRRGAALAELAPHLFRRRADIRLVGTDRPINATTPQAVFGADKHRLLSSAKLLLNIHRDRAAVESAPYFEWARAIEAMANGCVVVTEPSQGYEPLVAGTHFIEAEIDEMAAAIEGLLGDESRRAAIAKQARRAMFGELALHNSLAPLLDRIEADVLPNTGSHSTSFSLRRALADLVVRRRPIPVRFGAFRPFLPTLVTAKRLAMAENAALQRLDAASCELDHGGRQHIVRAETPAFADATPEVSVVVSLYNYADVVTDTLDSIVASEDVSFELIVVEDHATDDSRAVVQRFIDTNPAVPIVLIAKDANEGLAAARNTGFEHARAPLVMVMDADNTIYPTCLRKLADALNDTAAVDAAYSILEDFGEQQNIRSALAWDVDRLCRANYIDAQAMLRRSAWQRLGGYRADDDLVYGWEDWDLWLRLAADGGQAMLVTQILGRYRVQRDSMVALTNLANDDAIAAMRLRYPTLPWPGHSSQSRRLLDGILPAEEHYANVSSDDDPDLATS
ncbi:MAG: glycosyltransferase [Ilumatobacteraceae bacterium]